jgi:hypothetical membrane protein
VLLSAAIAICGIIQFVQGIWMAIEHYPYAFNPALEFLSVLGAQSASAPYFTRATVTLGVSMWPMFYSVVHQFGDDVPTSVVTFSALGIVSSFGLCGIGTAPYNQYTMHYVAVAAWLLPMLVMLPLKIPQPGQPRAGFSVAIIIPITVAAFVYITGSLLQGRLPDSPAMLTTFSQKLLIVTALLWMVSFVRVIICTAFHAPSNQ